MNDPAILDGFDGNMSTCTVSDSSDCEDSPAHGVYAPVDANLDNTFGDWTDYVEEDWRDQHHQRSASSDLIDPSTLPNLGPYEQKEKIVDSPSPWQILHDYFPMVNTSEDTPTGGCTPTLFQLLQKSETSPLSSPLLSGAASLWSCLLREPSGLRKSGTCLCPNALRGLLSALKVRGDVSSWRPHAPPAERNPTETSGAPPRPPAGPLIQTKLLTPSRHRDTPSFLYQISHQWVSKLNLRM